MKISESELKTLIKECVGNLLKEGPFGFSGNDFARLGLKNPADKYVINKDELAQKTNEFIAVAKTYIGYINGVEEDVENNIKETDGVTLSMKMHAMWSDDEDERGFAEDLQKSGYSLSRVVDFLQELVDYYCR